MTGLENEWPQLMGVGTRALVENARRLGLSWKLTLGTVTEATSENSMEVSLDGDTASITVVSMIGNPPIGTRVYVITVPPAGNYAIGQVNLPSPTRIATVVRTAASAGFTTETTVDSITADLVAGRTYRLYWAGRVQSSIADGYARGRIRQDTIAGTIIQTDQASTTIAAGQSRFFRMEVEYTPTVNETKTFVITLVRQAGTGTLTAFAFSDAPVYTYIDYVRG